MDQPLLVVLHLGHRGEVVEVVLKVEILVTSCGFRENGVSYALQVAS